jgi:hypothetical protein
MLSGPTWREAAIDGTAVLRIVVSSDSMNIATATSQGRRLLLVEESGWVSQPDDGFAGCSAVASPLLL